MRWLIAATLLVVALATPCAWAAAAPGVGGPPSASASSSQSTQATKPLLSETKLECSNGANNPFKSYIGLIHQGSADMARRLVGYGQIMLRAFLIVSLAWYGVLMMTSVGTSWAQPQELVMKIFFWGAVFSLFIHYGYIYEMISSAFNEIGDAAENVFNVVGGSSGNPISTTSCILDATANALMSKALNVPIMQHFHWYDLFTKSMLKGDLAWMGQLLFVFVVNLMLSAASLLFQLWGMSFTLLVGLGFGLGPVALPMMMFRFTRELAFDAWLGFIWSGLLYLVVGPALLGLLGLTVHEVLLPMAQHESIYQRSSSGALELNLSVMYALLVMAALMIYWMLKLPDIVKQLSSGAAHAGALPSLSSIFRGEK